MVERYTAYGTMLEATDPDMDAWFVRFDDYRDLAAQLAARDRTIANFDFDVCPKMAERSKVLESALREARRWIGDGDMGDGMDREIWTPAYAAVVDLVDAALTFAQRETKL
jgi:hypothetical protein